MNYENRETDTMSAFFRGKLTTNTIKSQPKMVELGHGKGVGHTDGSYDQYIKQLYEKSSKGNGLIYIGKTIDKEKMSIPDLNDKFKPAEIPKLLIMYYNILNRTHIKVEWKDMDNETILNQYYEIPSAHSMNYDWWDSYGVYFIGPEDLEEGNYKVDITSTELGAGDNRKVLKALINFSVVEQDQK